MTDYIFYKGDPHVFSNFHIAPIHIDGKVWATSEHYFQAMKFHGYDDEHKEKIRLAETTGKAYRLAWEKKIPCSNWDEIRNDVMRKALLNKFGQHVELEKILLDTGEKNIVQRCSKDKYWGDGYPGKGENMLGKLLMETRERIRRYESI
jgi:ribA/ribD-fused uncharacterized protein